MTTITKLSPGEQAAILRWPELLDIGIIRAETRLKEVHVNGWQHLDFSKVNFRVNLASGEYDPGIAVRTGKTISGKYYLIVLDFDGWDAIIAWFGSWDNVLALSKRTLVEWHNDTGSIHVFLLSTEPIISRRIRINADSQLEVRCVNEEGTGTLVYVSPSIHKSGKPYAALGVDTIASMQDIDLLRIKSKIDRLSDDYMSDVDKNAYDAMLEQPDIILGVHGGRHDATKFKIIRYYWKYSGDWLNLTDDQRFERAWGWHLAHCKPPRDRREFDQICKWVTRTMRQKRDALHETVRDERSRAKEGQPEAATKSGVVKISAQVLKIIEPQIDLLFKDNTDSAYAVISVNGHKEITPIYKTKRFDLWIRKAYYEQNNGATLSGDILREVTDTLQAKALFNGQVKNLDLRINKDPDDDLVYWYDLVNENREAIRMTIEGWDIVTSNQVPIIFRRRSGQLPQVYPSKDYPPDIFDQFIKLINVKDEENIRLLLKCYIISLIIPGIAKALLMVHGPQGAAKTALEDLIKMLIDPGVLTNLTIPTTRKELVQQLQHNFLTYYDNLRTMPSWLSDDLCRAVTGTANSKRELYTDDDDIIYQYMRPVGINGIPLVAIKSDLLDRGLIIELERIEPTKRRSFKHDIKPALERIRPQLLGFIFDTTVRVLQVKAKGGINLKSVSRMADFEIACETISRCLGYEDGKFTEAYRENKNIGIAEMLESSAVARAVIKLMDSNKTWIGTMTELLVVLEDVASMLKINTQKDKSWPKAAHILSVRLKEVKTDLEEAGIFMHTTQNTKTKTKTLILEKRQPEEPEEPDKADSRSDNSSFSGASSGASTSGQPDGEPDNNPKTKHDSSPSGASGASGSPFSKERGGVYKMYADRWGCHDCDAKGDRFYLESHHCRGQKKT